MALSTRKKNLIIAEWKAGKYKSAYAVSKAHKIDRKTAEKIIDGIGQTNADIVDICVIAENVKNSLKNPVEIKVIEAMVKEKTTADLIEDEVMSGTLENVKGIRTLLKESPEISERKLAQEAFDKALITAGKAPRHANQNINVQTNVQSSTSTTLTKEDAHNAYLEIMKQ